MSQHNRLYTERVNFEWFGFNDAQSPNYNSNNNKVESSTKVVKENDNDVLGEVIRQMEKKFGAPATESHPCTIIMHSRL